MPQRLGLVTCKNIGYIFGFIFYLPVRYLFGSVTYWPLSFVKTEQIHV